MSLENPPKAASDGRLTLQATHGLVQLVRQEGQCRCRIVFHLSLDDALTQMFSGQWVQQLLKRLGMKEDEAIESQMVARRIRQAQKRIQQRATRDSPADSAEEWLQRNCPSSSQGGEGMSEYQYVAFRAVDGPVSEKNLSYMRRQSSRAEITPWSFTNEYHYGDFHGNTMEMLRRGYDLHVHYANFGVRTLMIRLPEGFPDAKAAKAYLVGDALQFLKDKTGFGGTLIIQPFHEPGDLEELWDIEEILNELVPLRLEILRGDLRPLYIAHLAVSCDAYHHPEESLEAPVPAGLREPSAAQLALAKFYEISEAMIAAAARVSEPPPSAGDWPAQYSQWLSRKPGRTKDAWLSELMDDPSSSVRVRVLAQFRKDQRAASWPTTPPARTMAELEKEAREIEQDSEKKEAAKAARRRAKKLAKMAADPTPYLRETEQLVAQRTTDAYRQVSQLLADLREALAGSTQAGLAEKQAQKLKTRNPTLRLLTAALRREGFLPK